MEDLKNNLKQLQTCKLLQLQSTSSSEEQKSIIKEILDERGIELTEVPGDEYESSDILESLSNEITPIKDDAQKVNEIKNEHDYLGNTRMPEKPNIRKPERSYEALKSFQFYMVHSIFMKEFGSDAAIIIAIMLTRQQYYSRKKMLDEEGYFYLEHPQIERITGISKYRQLLAFEKLIEQEILTVSKKKKGTPPKKFYQVSVDNYEKVLQNLNDGRTFQ